MKTNWNLERISVVKARGSVSRSAIRVLATLLLTAGAIAILHAFTFSCAGQLVSGNQPVSVPRAVTAVRATEPPHLNGYLDQTWSQAAVITHFRQQYPHEGAQPTQRELVSQIRTGG